MKKTIIQSRVEKIENESFVISQKSKENFSFNNNNTLNVDIDRRFDVVIQQFDVFQQQINTLTRELRARDLKTQTINLRAIFEIALVNASQTIAFVVARSKFIKSNKMRFYKNQNEMKHIR